LTDKTVLIVDINSDAQSGDLAIVQREAAIVSRTTQSQQVGTVRELI
jgi:hypothetical protein